jgi:hypothetical protein
MQQINAQVGGNWNTPAIDSIKFNQLASELRSIILPNIIFQEDQYRVKCGVSRLRMMITPHLYIVKNNNRQFNTGTDRIYNPRCIKAIDVLDIFPK